jgi:DNA-binding response OmpR family regulator
MSNVKILVVDDELSIRLFLEETLTNDGHQVVAVESGERALELIDHQTFDLALLDLMLGGISGMEVLSALRQQSPDTVVIILTAHGSLETAVEALRQGAHDYLFKPCKTVQLRESIRQGLLKRQRELRQRGLLRQLEERLTRELEDIRATIDPDRTEKITTPGPAVPVSPLPTDPEPALIETRFLQQGDLIVDMSQHVITLDGHLLELSPTEFDVLAYLVSEAPRVISPQELVREVQGYTSEAWEARDTVRQHIYHIRQKLQKATGRTDIVRTVRGIGYTVSE